MAHPVIILTDSTAYLPAELVARYPIRVIPLTLNWDGQTYRDGVDIQAEEFYQRLSISKSIPTTSQVTSGELQKTIHALLEEGFDVLMLPISSGISSTYQTAAAEMQNLPVDRVSVLDTKLVSMALGFQVMTAARAAAAGADLSECTRAAQQTYANIGVYFTVEDLKYLAAGGRINNAKRLLGSAMSIKPILQIRDGKIELVCSVISRRKAIARMLDLVEEGIGSRTPVRLSVFHALAKEQAGELMETVQARFSPIECILAEVSPVVGTHVGPGTISVAYQAGTEK
jgi:DegV family protein with EDD domain